MSDSRVIIENRPEHLCVTCKYQEKCRRTKQIHQSLSDIESDALEEWKMNVDVIYQITECDMYAMDWEMMDAIQRAIDMLNGYGEDDDGDD